MSDEDFNAIWRGFEARIERLEDLQKELEETVKGSRRSKVTGLVSDSDRFDTELRRLNAVVFMDSSGKHGLAHDVDVLMGRQVGSDRRSEFRWKYWMPTILAILAMTLTILVNLDKIKTNFPKLHLSPLEQKIEKAKHPKGRKIVKVRLVPRPTQPQENPPSESIKESLPKSE